MSSILLSINFLLLDVLNIQAISKQHVKKRRANPINDVFWAEGGIKNDIYLEYIIIELSTEMVCFFSSTFEGVLWISYKTTFRKYRYKIQLDNKNQLKRYSQGRELGEVGGRVVGNENNSNRRKGRKYIF